MPQFTKQKTKFHIALTNSDQATAHGGQVLIDALCRRFRNDAGHEGSVTIQQDARLYATALEPGQRVAYPLGAGRRAWVQVARGTATLNGERLAQGDGAAVLDERELALTAIEPTEVLLFDLG